jgi:hypothetical protein
MFSLWSKRPHRKLTESFFCTCWGPVYWKVNGMIRISDQNNNTQNKPISCNDCGS